MTGPYVITTTPGTLSGADGLPVPFERLVTCGPDAYRDVAKAVAAYNTAQVA